MILIDRHTVDYIVEFIQETRNHVKIENMAEIIEEYKSQNKIDVMTEEEFTNIFGESTLYPYYFLPTYGKNSYYGFLISDYELSMFRRGVGLIEDPALELYLEHEDEMRKSEDGFDLGDAEQLSETDQFYDFRSDYYDDLIDKYYGTSTSRINMDLNSVQEEANDENFIMSYGCDLGYADSISQGEWECELQDEVESLPNWMGTKSIQTQKSNIVNLFNAMDGNIEKELQDADYVNEFEYEKELHDEIAVRSFKRRIKTKVYHYNDLNDVYKTLAIDMEQDTRVLKIYFRNFEVTKTFHLGSDEIGCFLELHAFEDDGRRIIGSCYSPDELIKCIEHYRPILILREEKIEKICNLGIKSSYDGTINLDVEQALIIMLQITHLFKSRMDYQSQCYKKNANPMQKDVEQFKAESNIKNKWDEKECNHKHGALHYHISIQHLLLQTLYALNGRYYDIDCNRNRWEESFNKIFVDMPCGKDFDQAMIDFILLPLYNYTHEIYYKLKWPRSKNDDESSKASKK